MDFPKLHIEPTKIVCGFSRQVSFQDLYQTTWHIFGMCKHIHACTQTHMIFMGRIINFSPNNKHMLIIFLVELICSHVLSKVKSQIDGFGCVSGGLPSQLISGSKSVIILEVILTLHFPMACMGWVPCAGPSGKVCSISQCSCYLCGVGESRAHEKDIFLPLHAFTFLSVPLHLFPVFWSLREPSCISGVQWTSPVETEPIRGQGCPASL